MDENRNKIIEYLKKNTIKADKRYYFDSQTQESVRGSNLFGNGYLWRDFCFEKNVSETRGLLDYSDKYGLKLIKIVKKETKKDFFDQKRLYYKSLYKSCVNSLHKCFNEKRCYKDFATNALTDGYEKLTLIADDYNINSTKKDLLFILPLNYCISVMDYYEGRLVKGELLIKLDIYINEDYTKIKFIRKVNLDLLDECKEVFRNASEEFINNFFKNCSDEIGCPDLYCFTIPKEQVLTAHNLEVYKDIILDPNKYIWNDADESIIHYFNSLDGITSKEFHDKVIELSRLAIDLEKINKTSEAIKNIYTMLNPKEKLKFSEIFNAKLVENNEFPCVKTNLESFNSVLNGFGFVNNKEELEPSLLLSFSKENKAVLIWFLLVYKELFNEETAFKEFLKAYNNSSLDYLFVINTKYPNNFDYDLDVINEGQEFTKIEIFNFKDYKYLGYFILRFNSYIDIREIDAYLIYDNQEHLLSAGRYNHLRRNMDQYFLGKTPDSLINVFKSLNEIAQRAHNLDWELCPECGDPFKKTISGKKCFFCSSKEYSVLDVEDLLDKKIKGKR